MAFISVFFVFLLQLSGGTCITYCPLQRPYAYYGGRYCCLYNEEKSSYEYRGSYRDEHCDGSKISLTSKCCRDDEYYRCVSGDCQTPPLNDSGPCPEEFPNPYYYGLYCCKYNTEKVSFTTRTAGPACQNGNLTINSLCCYDDRHTPCLNPPCTASAYWSLTWHAEGNDDPNDPDFGRRLRVRTGGPIVLGRGYFLTIPPPYIVPDLESIGIPSASATLIAVGAFKTGNDAQTYITANSLQNFTITPKQQWKLFTMQLEKKINEVKAIFIRSDVNATYGSADFDTRHPSIKGVAVDLAFSGGYTELVITLIQSAVVQNDVIQLKNIMSNRTSWASVSDDRFTRRKVYMQRAVDAV